MDEAEFPVALYRFFDTGGVLLYVGVTNNPTARWKAHSLDKSWWSEVDDATVEWLPGRRAALAAELAAIQTEHPKYNVQGVIGYGGRPRLTPDEVNMRRLENAARDAEESYTERRAAVLAASDSGASVREIAKIARLSSATVQIWIREHRAAS